MLNTKYYILNTILSKNGLDTIKILIYQRKMTFTYDSLLVLRAKFIVHGSLFVVGGSFSP